MKRLRDFFGYAIELIVLALTAPCAMYAVAQESEALSGKESTVPTAPWDGCDEKISPRIRIDSGHPWQPPFGVDRVGAAPVVHVDLISERPPRRDYYVIAYRKGNESERRSLDLAADRFDDWPVEFRPKGPSPFFSSVRFRSIPEEVVLYARCPHDGRVEELMRQEVNWPDIEADAMARPDRQINPVDLGMILVPQDSLLLAGGQTAVITAAAISHARDLPQARLRAWFDEGNRVDTAMPLVASRRETKVLHIPLRLSSDRAVLHISLNDGHRELWKKEIPTMIVARPPRWPTFGAVETKLRYDAPISVMDPQTGAFSSLDYDTAWDAQRNDVVVFLPNGSRFVFWRGSSYIPFWAGQYNTGVCYQWAENLSRPDDAVDMPEPLMDKELRYGRVRIVESTPTRVHVRWTYQSADFLYQVWGDQATEDFYFYPDGFGTRVLTLASKPGDFYQVSEFIVLTPQSAFPLEVLPSHMADVLFIDGEKNRVTFPFPPDESVRADLRFAVAGKIPNRRQLPMLYRIFAHKDDPAAAISFNPRDPTTPVAFRSFHDRGHLVTPAYWGSHWPLSRGKMTGLVIDDRIYSSPTHNSLLTWLDWPKPLSAGEFSMPDALGRSRTMAVQLWAWLISKTDAPDNVLLEWAQSYSDPPSLKVTGAHIDFPSYSPERRAMRLVVESDAVKIELKPVASTVNPVFELDQAPHNLTNVTIDGNALPADDYTWDGRTLWIKTSVGTRGANIGLRFQ